MSRRISELIGQRFGRVTITGEGEYGGYGHCWVRCKCDCGVEFTTLYSSLRRGSTRSCGCVRKETSKELAKSHTKAVRGISTDGRVLVFKSVREASNAVGRTPDGISRALYGRQRTAGGYKWEFV